MICTKLYEDIPKMPENTLQSAANSMSPDRYFIVDWPTRRSPVPETSGSYTLPPLKYDWNAPGYASADSFDKGTTSKLQNKEVPLPLIKSAGSIAIHPASEQCDSSGTLTSLDTDICGGQFHFKLHDAIVRGLYYSSDIEEFSSNIANDLALSGGSSSRSSLPMTKTEASSQKRPLASSPEFTEAAKALKYDSSDLFDYVARTSVLGRNSPEVSSSLESQETRSPAPTKPPTRGIKPCLRLQTKIDNGNRAHRVSRYVFDQTRSDPALNFHTSSAYLIHQLDYLSPAPPQMPARNPSRTIRPTRTRIPTDCDWAIGGKRPGSLGSSQISPTTVPASCTFLLDPTPVTPITTVEVLSPILLSQVDAIHTNLVTTLCVLVRKKIVSDQALDKVGNSLIKAGNAILSRSGMPADVSARQHHFK